MIFADIYSFHMGGLDISRPPIWKLIMTEGLNLQLLTNLFNPHFFGGIFDKDFCNFAIIIWVDLMAMVLSGKCQFGQLYWLMNCLVRKWRVVEELHS